MYNNQTWFNVEKIDDADATFSISEYGHWEETHSYLFVGRDSAALIDTGTGVGDIGQVAKSLTDLPIRVITTHAHWDHIGGHHHFDDISIHSGDAAWLENGLPLPPDAIKRDLVKEPFSRPVPPNFSPDTYQVYTGTPTHILEDGDDIDLGGRTLTVLHTPGHSPGHICVYEEATGYLATGDLVYEGTIYAHYPSTDPAALCRSVQRLAALPNVKKLLPGHHRPDIPVVYLERMCDLCTTIAAQGNLKHGSGLHQGESIALLI